MFDGMMEASKENSSVIQYWPSEIIVKFSQLSMNRQKQEFPGGWGWVIGECKITIRCLFPFLSNQAIFLFVSQILGWNVEEKKGGFLLLLSYSASVAVLSWEHKYGGGGRQNEEPAIFIAVRWWPLVSSSLSLLFII